MDLRPPVAKAALPEIKVYFEDDEACEVFRKVTTRGYLKQLEAQYNVNIKPMPLGVGCSSLSMLPEKDDYFKTVVLATDADATKPKRMPPNLLELPGEIGADGNGLSPERSIIKYIRALVNDPKAAHPIAWADPRLKKYSPDNLEANLLVGYDDPLDRKRAKGWWRDKRLFLNEWGLYDIWAKENPALIEAYEERLEQAVKAAAKARRARDELAKRLGGC